jgi:signal transduction histidine kinase
MDGNGLDAQAAELSALRRENAMLRETLDTIDGTVVVYGPDLRYRFGNAGYHKLFPHLPPDTELAGRHYAEVLEMSINAGVVGDAQAYDDDRAFIARRVAEMQDRARSNEEFHHVRTGNWSLMRVKWTPNGNSVALRVDITEIKRLQQELARAQRMETIGRISGGVAHDFNNLLTVIISSLEMIRARPQDTARVRLLSATALGAAENGAGLIRQLLTFAHRDMTRPRIRDLNEWLAEMGELLDRTTGPDIPLDMALDPDAGAANVDSAQFEAAIMNLVLNAREAVLAGGGRGRIRIATRREGEEILLSVADTGPGMTQEVATRAFEPFFTTKPVGGGPGLGLSQVYGFATGSGGQVRIESTPGHGTVVTVSLPRVVAAAAAVAE